MGVVLASAPLLSTPPLTEKSLLCVCGHCVCLAHGRGCSGARAGGPQSAAGGVCQGWRAVGDPEARCRRGVCCEVWGWGVGGVGGRRVRLLCRADGDRARVALTVLHAQARIDVHTRWHTTPCHAFSARPMFTPCALCPALRVSGCVRLQGLDLIATQVLAMEQTVETRRTELDRLLASFEGEQALQYEQWKAVRACVFACVRVCVCARCVCVHRAPCAGRRARAHVRAPCKCFRSRRAPFVRDLGQAVACTAPGGGGGRRGWGKALVKVRLWLKLVEGWAWPVSLWVSSPACVSVCASHVSRGWCVVCPRSVWRRTGPRSASRA